MIPFIGYANPLSGRPGDVINFCVSSDTEQPYQADLVRVVCADPNPAGPGLVEHPVDGVSFGGSLPSRRQPFYAGSYARVSAAAALFTELRQGFTLAVNAWPTLPGDGEQTLLDCGSANRSACRLFIDAAGRVACNVADTAEPLTLHAGTALRARAWYRVWASYDATSGTLTVGRIALPECTGERLDIAPPEPDCTVSVDIGTQRLDLLRGAEQILIAAAGSTQASPYGHFNGKLEAPLVFDHAVDTAGISALTADGFHTAAGLLAGWDFSQAMSSTQIKDIGPHHAHGVLANAPARAMTGSNWDGSEMCWRHAPQQYGAIHFHDDDIYDFGWQTDFSFTIPAHLPSGIYAARLRCGEYSDRIPFFVCPPMARPGAKLAVLASTFTYSIYGNHARPDFEPDWMKKTHAWGGSPWNPAQHREYGLSTYNVHRDGSGICHASHRRPLMNLKPGYITYGNSDCSGLRHFQADSHLTAWLEQQGIAYDIITDRELHDDGVAALAGYTAVTTGSHPEYHTPQTLDALQQYRDGGGNFLYLGGNGFYWRVALHPEQPDLIEIRRAEGGIRAWAAEPGEYYHAFDGGYGGLWRRNGRPPQRLAAVGFSAQGNFFGSYYRRTEASHDTELAWLFDGIDNEEQLGNFGLSGGGAAGFELDRADERLGTPPDARVVARSERHHESFVLVPEEQLTHITTLPGEPPDDLLRADMVYHRNAAGGELFAVGSITFCGSLLVNGGDNNISTLLANVLKRFLA